MATTASIDGSSVKRPFFTIGHSNRSFRAFVDLIRDAGVEVIADIRTVPGSRAYPQFNADALARKLVQANLRYEHIPALGGLRKKSREIPADVNGFWENRSFHNYADYALSAEFKSGLARLREIGHESTCAVMCAEAVWWRCHRRIVADYLIAAGEVVLHIVGRNHIERAELTRGAEAHGAGTIQYPPETSKGRARERPEYPRAASS